MKLFNQILHVIIFITICYDGKTQLKFCILFNILFQHLYFILVTSSPSARLVDGSVPSEGRLEMKFRDEWGTVCNRAVTTEDEVTAICRLLGYSGRNRNVSYLTTARFGNGNLRRIWFYSGSCFESSTRMTLCAKPFPVDEGVRYTCNYEEGDIALGISCDGNFNIFLAST